VGVEISAVNKFASDAQMNCDESNCASVGIIFSLEKGKFEKKYFETL